MSEAAGRISAGRLVAFAAPCLPLAAIGLPLVVYLPEFYSNTLGLPVAAVGAAFLTVRLADIGFDPLFGLVLDRTRTPAGRYRPWLAVAAVLLMIACAILFFASPGAGLMRLWFGLLVAYGAFSVGVLSQTAWGAALSDDYQGRSRVYAVWQGANVVGILLAMIAPVLFAKLTGQSDAGAGIRAMGTLVMGLAPMTVLLAALAVKEPPARSQRHAQLSDWLRLLGRPNVLRVLAADVLMGVATGVQGALFFFYFERAKGLPRGQAELVIVLYFIAAVVGAAAWTPIARRFGKSGGVIAASLFVLVAQGLLALVPAGQFALLAGAAALSGLPYSAAPFLLRSAMADIADEERLGTGQDQTGLLYALAAGGAKVGAALSGGALVILGLLGFSGSDPAASSVAGEAGLRLIYLAGPALLALLAAIPMVGYPLTAARHAEIRRTLNAQS